MKKLILSIIIISSIAVSCKDDHDHDEPLATANIEIVAPAIGAMFMQNDTVHIKGSIQANAEIHGYEVLIKNTSLADTLVFYMDNHSHVSNYMIDTFWVNNVKMHSDMLLELNAIVSHDGAKTTKSVGFHCHPM